MASLTDGRMIVTTAAGVRISGGKLRIYDHGTTNLTSVYSDFAMTVPLSNPVEADSAGVLPQIFGLEGAIVDCAMLTAANVPLSGRDWIGALFGGSSNGVLLDMTNSRYAVRGSGGVVYIEVGDPSPDNVGGTGQIGGWNGTQADSITVDAVLLNTTGAIKEAGKKFPGVVYTEATTFTAVSEVLITLPNDPVGTRAWQVDLFDLFQSGAVDIRAQMSVDGGATYLSGASDYSCATVMTNHSAQTCNALAVVDTSYWLLGYDFVGLTNRPGGGTLQIITPRSGSFGTRVTSKFDGFFSATDWRTYSSHMMTKASFGSVDHIRIFPTSGTITGKYRVTPLRGYGEV